MRRGKASICSLASTIARATVSQRTIPPKILMKTTSTVLSESRMRNAFSSASSVALPPTSRKMRCAPRRSPRPRSCWRSASPERHLRQVRRAGRSGRRYPAARNADRHPEPQSLPVRDPRVLRPGRAGGPGDHRIALAERTVDFGLAGPPVRSTASGRSPYRCRAGSGPAIAWHSRWQRQCRRCRPGFR